MYKIEQYLNNRGFKLLPQELNESLIYNYHDEIEVMLIPSRRVWEITSSGPYLITLSMKEPKNNLAEFHAKLLKDYINDYMLKLREDLLCIKNPWEIIK